MASRTPGDFAQAPPVQGVWHFRSYRGVTFEIRLVGGAPHIRLYDVDGNPIFQRLHRRRINRRINKKDGTVRLSAEYDMAIDPKPPVKAGSSPQDL